MEWTVVSKKSKGRIRSYQHGTVSAMSSVSYLSFREKIEKSKEFLRAQPWIEDVFKAVAEIRGKIIGVGIGNFSSSLNSITQQSLYELLIEFNGSSGEVYDPAYLDEEIEYLKEKGFKVNEGDFDLVQDNSAVYFMIHCHFTLYEKLLKADWIQDQSIIIIGNNIESIKSSFSHRENLNNKNFRSRLINTKDTALNDTYINKNY